MQSVPTTIAAPRAGRAVSDAIAIRANLEARIPKGIVHAKRAASGRAGSGESDLQGATSQMQVEMRMC